LTGPHGIILTGPHGIILTGPHGIISVCLPVSPLYAYAKKTSGYK